MTDTQNWDQTFSHRRARERKEADVIGAPEEQPTSIAREDAPKIPVLRLDAAPDLELELPANASFTELEQHLQGRALLFLSRGVVHKMNNVLAVFMSLTQLVGLRGPGRSPIRQSQDLGPYQDSVDQGLSVISLLSDLTPCDGDPESSALCVGPLLQTLAQTLLCEEGGARYPVISLNQPQVYTSLHRRRLTACLLLLIEHVLREGCSSFRGQLELRAEDWEGQPSIRVRFRLPSEYLPFPIEHQPISREYLEYCHALGLGVRVLEGEPGYRLVLPGL